MYTDIMEQRSNPHGLCVREQNHPSHRQPVLIVAVVQQYIIVRVLWLLLCSAGRADSSVVEPHSREENKA